jgi:hypothetical protein
MNEASSKLEEELTRISVALVLPNGIVNALLRELVLELEGRYREPIDEEREVKRELRIVLAVLKLPGDAEQVRFPSLHRLLIARRRGAIEELDLCWTVSDSLSEDVHDSPFCDFALQPIEELESARTIASESQLLERFWLGFLDELQKVGDVDGVVSVEVLGAPEKIACTRVPGGSLSDSRERCLQDLLIREAREKPDDKQL